MLKLKISIGDLNIYDFFVTNDETGHKFTANYDVEVFKGEFDFNKEPVFEGKVEGFNKHEGVFALTEKVMALVKGNVKS